MSSSLPGGRLPIRSDLALGARAAEKFVMTRDVPDVLGFADYVASPDLTLGLVHERMAAETLFVDSHRFPLPKTDGATRGLTVMSPVTELALRTYVGRCSRAVRDATDEAHVLNGLVRSPGPGWFSADFREQYRIRRDRQRASYEADNTGAVGFVDVKTFFPSCRHDLLHAELETIGAPPGAAAVLVGMLSELFPTGVGLPIGFEGSGPMANLLLRPLDSALVNEGLDFVRWTDDIDVFLPDESHGPALLHLVEQKLGEVALRMHPTKTCVLPKGPLAEQRLLDPSRDSLLGEGAVDNVKARLDLHMWMKELGVTDEMPAGHLRTYLGLLRNDADPGGLSYLHELPGWLDREPRAVGDYLVELARSTAARSALDANWLVDRAVGRAPEKDIEAGQLHACRALAAYRLDASRGRKLLDFALQSDVLLNHPVLGSWAVRAWSASHAWNKSDAFDVIDAVAHLDYRRSSAVGFRGNVPGNPEDLRKRARLAPELAPAVEYALAA